MSDVQRYFPTLLTFLGGPGSTAPATTAVSGNAGKRNQSRIGMKYRDRRGLTKEAKELKKLKVQANKGKEAKKTRLQKARATRGPHTMQSRTKQDYAKVQETHEKGSHPGRGHS